MRLGSKILLAIGLMATVIAVGFWLARIFVQTPATVTDSAPEGDAGPAPVNTAVSVESDPSLASAKSTRPPEPATGPSPAAATVAGTNHIADWENRIDEILRLDSQPAEAARKLMALLPHVPPDGRIEALQLAASLLPDEDYAPMGKMLSDPRAPEDEIDILMRDVLNRSNETKLPRLLEVARTAGHPKAGEAREILEVFLGESYDNDWDKWQLKVNEFLKENPEAVASGDP